MSRLIAIAILFSTTLLLSGWQKTPAKPNFTGVWQLDPAKSKTEVKDDLSWKIDQTPAEISIEELSGGKSLSNTKCVIGKVCEFSENGKKRTAMTYYLDTTLVQIRSAADNSSVIKRHLKMNDDGSLQVELITLVPSDKTETIVFNKQTTASTH
jgi:hypothetical protein